MIEGLVLGLGTTLVASGPVEWGIHTYILHSKSRPNEFIRKASVAHNDEHHVAFRGPDHYYRDVTNEHVTVHFGVKDVALIVGGSAAFGAALGTSTPFSVVGSTIGSVVGALTSYGAYEFTHHYMHVIGERRLQIGRVFGDHAEGERSGNLRLPKPTLDSLCDTIEDRVDGKKGEFRLQDNCASVLENNYGITTKLDDMIEYTVDRLLQWEGEYLSDKSKKEKLSYHVQRKILRGLRHSSLFRRLDNHHFVHHRSVNKNLNVVWMWYDHLAGSKEDCSERMLIDDKRYWLCPNSPDVEPFVSKSRD